MVKVLTELWWWLSKIYGVEESGDETEGVNQFNGSHQIFVLESSYPTTDIESTHRNLNGSYQFRVFKLCDPTDHIEIGHRNICNLFAKL